MILREMVVDDLDQVMEIEQDLFAVPWTREGYFTFLTRDDAMFLVVEEKGRILAYCGLLMVLDEGDVTNVAVRRDRQKRPAVCMNELDLPEMGVAGIIIRILWKMRFL